VESGGSRRHAEYSNEQSHRSSQIAYRSESDYKLTLKKFPATTGGHAPMSLSATPLLTSLYRQSSQHFASYNIIIITIMLVMIIIVTIITTAFIFVKQPTFPQLLQVRLGPSPKNLWGLVFIGRVHDLLVTLQHYSSIKE